MLTKVTPSVGLGLLKQSTGWFPHTTVLSQILSLLSSSEFSHQYLTRFQFLGLHSQVNCSTYLSFSFLTCKSPRVIRDINCNCAASIYVRP